MHVRKNDIVKVLSGDHKGATGKVLSVDWNQERILVEGVNFVWKHLRRSQQHPHGARIQKEAPVALSKIQVICQSCNKPTRVVMKDLENAGRTRICRKCKQAVTPEG